MPEHSRPSYTGFRITLEAGNGADFDDRYARVSTYTGLPTVMGWAGHEVQWRGDIPAIRQRVRDVNAMYGSASTARTEALLRKYHVAYVVVGTVERHVPHAHPQKFLHFMRPVYRRGATAIYTW